MGMGWRLAPPTHHDRYPFCCPLLVYICLYRHQLAPFLIHAFILSISICSRHGNCPGPGGVGGAMHPSGILEPGPTPVTRCRSAPALSLSLPGTTRPGTSCPKETPSTSENGAMPPVMWQATHLPFQMGWMDCW